MNYKKSGQIRGFTNIYIYGQKHGWQDLERGHWPVYIMFQVVRNPLVSPLPGLVLPLQWNHPFLASLPAGEQASLLLQMAGFNKRPGCFSAVFNFLRSWKRRCKSSCNLLLCPLRFSLREIPLCWFFFYFIPARNIALHSSFGLWEKYGNFTVISLEAA